MRRSKSRAFYLETLLLVLFLLGVLAVLAQLFAGARHQSLAAQRLTQATQIARNVSEAFAASGGWQEFGALIAGGDGLCWQEDQAVLPVDENGGARQGGAYALALRRGETPAGAGRLAELTIEVCTQEGKEPVYTLTVQKYLPAAQAG
ncbi:hypothetical protein [Allofournierella sp.]|uniref:hypothetical protein n=1 Tax=Allofournierella sp. TaxID=1940256 RepID=UPI003AB4C9EE